MDQESAGVKPGQVDSKRREVPCERCKQPVRWAHVEGGSFPLTPALVWVRQPAHGEDPNAHLEVVFAAEDGPHAKKGWRVVGVACDPGHPGAIAGRWRHQCAGEGGGGIKAQAALARELGRSVTSVSSKASTSAPSTQPMTPQERERLAGLLREALEDALDAQGCVWTETERGVVITPETRPPKGSAGAVRIARLCAAVRIVEGVGEGAWVPRQAGGGGQ